jgi:hypothetical protein
MPPRGSKGYGFGFRVRGEGRGFRGQIFRFGFAVEGVGLRGWNVFRVKGVVLKVQGVEFRA